MKGSHLVWLSRSKGMTVDIWIRDYNPPRCFQKKISGRSNVHITGNLLNNISSNLFQKYKKVMLGLNEFNAQSKCESQGDFGDGQFYLI
jgi:hypothetical protein